MQAAEQLLARLEGVRVRADNSWTALCPAHDDRKPSLSVDIKAGRLLVYCRAGCTLAGDVLPAIGLGLADLYDRPEISPAHPVAFIPVAVREDVKRLSHVATVVGLAAADLRYGNPLTDFDHQTLIDALHEINQIARKLESVGRRR